MKIKIKVTIPLLGIILFIVHFVMCNQTISANALYIVSDFQSMADFGGKEYSGSSFTPLISIGIDTLPIYTLNTRELNNQSFLTNYKTYWWNDAIFYEIFVRSFFDGNNDGKGDFRGIIDKLDYLNDGDSTTDKDLGISAIWLMPVMPSPSYHGYDVTDYYTTNPEYGNMSDFQELITKGHARGIKVIIDFVMNHTSDRNPWFIQSVNSLNGYRDWYVWSNTDPGFKGPQGQTVWNYDYNSGTYYYAFFGSGMPDLNYRDSFLKSEMFKVADFWLEKGVDGFRLDAVNLLVEDGSLLMNTPETLDLLGEFNASYKAQNPDGFTIGEVWSSTSTIIPYVQNERLDACFEFDLANSILSGVNSRNPVIIQNQLNIIQQSYPTLQYGTFLTNHDQNRVFDQLGNDLSKMKQASSIYLTLPGIPFIYYGEEIGMTGSGRDENKRRPMQWTSGTNGGFSTQTPWFDLGENYLTNNVQDMSSEQGSILQHYKKLISIRNGQSCLRKGYLLNLNTIDNNILAFARIYQDEAIIVLSNFGSFPSYASFSMPVSTLPEGKYYVTELYTGLSMGMTTVNSNGDISNWQFPFYDLVSRDTWILHLTSEKPNSVSEVTYSNSNYYLYPNPANAQVQIKSYQSFVKDGLIEVFTFSGSKIYQAQFTGNLTSINTTEWPTGVYFVKVTSAEKSKIERLMVMK